MDKSNQKGRVRSRYAKLQPLVNRLNEVQGLNSSPNCHAVKRYNESGMFESYAHQLQSDFENLALDKSKINTSKETEVIGESMYTELQNLKIPATVFDRSVFSTPVTNAGMLLRKQKKQKHRNKENLSRMSLLDLKTDLQDIMNYILCTISSPIIFFAGLIIALTSSLASALYDVSKLIVRRCNNSIRKDIPSQLASRRHQISNFLPLKSAKEKDRLEFKNKFFIKQSSDSNPGGRCVPQREKNDDRIGQAQSENGKIQKELKSLKKKFNLSLEMVDEIRAGNLEFGDRNYLQYCSRLQDISSVELSSDCRSDKYNSSILLDYRNRGKRPARQFQDSISGSGMKASASATKNPTHRKKRLQINSRNFSPQSELRFFMKNLDAAVSDASEISEKQLQKISPKNRFCGTNEHTDSRLRPLDHDSPVDGTEQKFNLCKNSSAIFMVNHLRKKRFEKSRASAIPSLSLRQTLEKKSPSQVEEKCEKLIDKSDRSLSADFENLNRRAPNELKNGNFQPVVKPDPEVNKLKESESFMDMEKDSSRKKESNSTATVSIILNEYNAQKLVSERDAGPSSLGDCKLDLNTLENGTRVSGRSTEISGPDVKGIEKEKSTNGSGDRVKLIKEEKWRSTDFTKPIDAKSKWIEMKKKFYGKDYPRAKNLPGHSEAQNLPQIKSVSKLPAHKIFQYNMLVGRARQMGTELPLPEEISLDKKKTSSSIKATKGDASGPNPERDDAQSFISAIPTVRCLSHTQSLSQWPDTGNSLASKRNSLQEQRPQPKPKPRTEAGLNCGGIVADRKTSKLTCDDTPQFAQRPAPRTNSSVSSSDFRNLRTSQSGLGPLDWPSQLKNTAAMNPNSYPDEYAEKIDSLVSFCRYPFLEPKESIHKNLEPDAQKLLDEVATGSSS